MGNSSNRHIASSFKKTFRFFLNMGINASQSYILNLFKIYEIHNDLGASSTSLQRKRTKIIKRAISPEAEEKLRDEIVWIQQFAKNKAKEYLPTILDYSMESGNTYYVMRYYNMPNLRKVILNNMSTFYFLKKRVDFLLDIQRDVFHAFQPSVKTQNEYFRRVYSDKLYARFTKGITMEPRINELIHSDYVQINGKQYIGPKRLFDAIAADEDIVSALTPAELYVTHGDLHCNNILCGVPISSVKLLDCRGRNSDGSLYFDVAYDIAKLYHDFHGKYSFIENRLYTTSLTSPTSVSYRFKKHKSVPVFTSLYEHTRNEVEAKFSEFGRVNYRADFIESHLFLTMIVFHFSTFEEGLICLARGIEFLNNWAQTYHPDLVEAIYAQVAGEPALEHYEQGARAR